MRPDLECHPQRRRVYTRARVVSFLRRRVVLLKFAISALLLSNSSSYNSLGAGSCSLARALKFAEDAENEHRFISILIYILYIVCIRTLSHPSLHSSLYSQALDNSPARAYIAPYGLLLGETGGPGGEKEREESMGYHTTRKLVEQNKDTLEMIRTIVVERGEELRFDVPEGMYSNGQFWFWQLFASAQRFKDMYGGRYVDIKDQVKTKFDTRAEQVVIIPASPGYKSIPTLERKNDKKILEELKEYGGDIFSGFFYTPQDFNPEEFKERAKALDFEVIILDIRDDGQVQVTAQRIEKPSIAASLGFSTQRRPPRSPSDESLEEIMEELKRAKGER